MRSRTFQIQCIDLIKDTTIFLLLKTDIIFVDTRVVVVLVTNRIEKQGTVQVANGVDYN